MSATSGAGLQPAGYAALMSAVWPDHRRLAWQDSALCAETDPELFFPGRGGRATAKAEKVCAACPVLLQCRRWIAGVEADLADNAIIGFYAGLTANQRKEARRASRRAAA